MSPIVSVIIANYNGGRFVRDALHSAARQTLRDIEIIFVDDGSTDESFEIASQIARHDGRIRIIRLAGNSGPGAARNAGLAEAQGRWIAILDSDDMMHPDRLRLLVDEIVRSQANICADDLLVFQDGVPPKTFLSDRGAPARWIPIPEYILANRLFSSAPALGYLKPLFDAEFLRANALSYDTKLRIGEDYDFVLRQLLRGAKYRLVGSLGYFYRKHARSTSHRISAAELDALLDADRDIRDTMGEVDPALLHAFETRHRSLKQARSFTELVTLIKSRDWSGAAKTAARSPEALSLLRLPVMARLRRLLPEAARAPPPGAAKQACVISRQRIIGNTNGSSRYLLSLCEALRARGYRIRLISPNPATFGRWPFLYLRPEMAVFDEVFIRGSWRIGRRLFLAADPRVHIAALLTIAGKLLQKLGLAREAWTKPAPYAIAVPWSVEDQLYIARHAPRGSRAVIADYAFLTPGIPYALSPDARSLVVMHDLFCSRTSQFESAQAADSVATLDEASELALLSQADAVVAIQANEAAFVAKRLPHTSVILAPMAVSTVRRPQPGDSKTILFVGSNTAPNIVGLRWFLDNSWPLVRAASPDVVLRIAGTVCQNLSGPIDGVRFLGLVPDLDPLYREAGVVISPLTVGSGLKIKLIEALGQGKAVVATSATVDGVQDTVKQAVTVADDAAAFAASITRLLQDEALRVQKCEEAIAVAARSFSSESYADLLEFIERPSSALTGADIGQAPAT